MISGPARVLPGWLPLRSGDKQELVDVPAGKFVVVKDGEYGVRIHGRFHEKKSLADGESHLLNMESARIASLRGDKESAPKDPIDFC